MSAATSRDRPRPGRDRDQHDPRAAAQGGRGQGRAAPPRSACSTRWSATSAGRRPARSSAGCCARARSTTGRSRSRCRRAAPRHADLRHPGHARRADGHAQSRRHVRQGVRRPQGKRKKLTVAESYELLMAEESDKLLDQEQVTREAHPAGRAERHRLPRRDRQDLRRATGRMRRRRQPRGRAARPAAADRGHHGRDQARPGQDRPHPVHRLAAPSTWRSRRTCCPSCRAACRSGSS